jgi:chaperonin GroEL
MPTPQVLLSPEAGTRLKRGFDQLADLLALTLGPTQGEIVSHNPAGTELERLSDAATIARRIMQLPDRGEDVGAMLLRNLVWRVHQRVGDGCATTAVLAQAIFHEAHRAVAAGANPMTLRRGLREATTAALNALEAQARPIAGEADLIRVAQSVTTEPDLSLVLGEMFALLGPDAHVTVEDYMAPYLEREYLEGGRWKGRLASRLLITDPKRKRAVLSNCPVILFDGEIETLEALRPMVELLARLEHDKLALIARKIKGEALQALVANHQQENLEVVAAELIRPGDKGAADLEDLAALTGAQVLGTIPGESLRRISPKALGRAQRVEADTNETLSVVGDASQNIVLREQVATLRRRLDALPVSETEAQEALRQRLARLTGSSGVLKIGAYTKHERSVRRQKAEKALRALPFALREGVVPGGGVGYLNCIPAVEAMSVTDTEEQWSHRIIANALEAPFRRIVRNTGRAEPGALLAEARRRGAGFGYNAIADEVVDMRASGILDAAGILRVALETAVSGAVMALTTDVTVLRRRPQKSFEP